MIRVSALKGIPEMVQGYVRDISVRWALNEAGLVYETYLTTGDERRSPAYLARQPFAQVPAFEENGVHLFESGAIVLHIAERSTVLMPQDPAGRAQVQSWMFAAMNTIDPVVKAFEQIEYMCADEEWAKLRRPAVLQAASTRLQQLATALNDREYLTGKFSAADILMVMSLRNLGPSDLFLQIPRLVAYVQRGEARPHFQAAMKRHLAGYAKA